MLDLYKNALAERGVVSFYIRVRPGASVTTLKEVMDDGSLKVDIAAIPERGKANAELVRFLAEKFDVQVQNVQIVSGETSGYKAVRIIRSL